MLVAHLAAFFGVHLRCKPVARHSRPSLPRYLDALSKAYVHYYRCEACGRVWTPTKPAQDHVHMVALSRRWWPG